MSQRVSERIESLTRQDVRGGVWCAMLCAQSVQHVTDDYRLNRGLRLAAAWAQGAPIKTEILFRAAEAAKDAAFAFNRTHPSFVCFAAFASFDVVAAANAAHPDAVRKHANTAEMAAAAVDAASAALPTPPPFDALVDHQVEPIDPQHGDHPLWDWVVEHCPGPVRYGALGDALARAREWRLSWEVPWQRAIAERLTQLPPGFRGPCAG